MAEVSRYYSAPADPSPASHKPGSRLWLKLLGFGCGVPILLCAVPILALHFVIQSNLDAGAQATQEGRIDEAIARYETVRAMNPDFAPVRPALGYLYFKTGRPDQGIGELRAAVRLEPRNLSYHDQLTNALLIAGRYAEAEQEARIAIGLNGADSAAHNNLAGACKMQGRFDEAEREYQVAIQLDPGDLSAQKNLAKMRRQLNGR
ncbi:MAG TPA: tetratricopeptide repeat protein [Chthonomonadaceae bacterium]|nr:tetratricopeptide repeat protein [Chthonomonadaceae bacterium]